MSNIEQVQQVSNSPILWLLCGVTVVISAIQTVLYMRQCSKTTRAAGLDPKIPKEAFRVGLISAIGIAAVALGGTSMNGGRGKIWGTFIGVLIIAVLNNGLNILGVSSYYQDVVKGIVILIAVLSDRRR